jgi:PPOX class probable F420-dependent enzyme
VIPKEHREFLESHRLAVVAVQREGKPPSLSPVYYTVEGDDLLISTTATRLKGKAPRKNPDVALCVLGEEFPFPYLTVYGKARIEEQGAADVMARIAEKMFRVAISTETMPIIAQRAAEEKRVVMRVTPERFSSRPAQ